VLFSSQCLPDMENVSEDFIERVFAEASIGKFAHLSISEDVFIQAGSKGTPSNCVPPDDPDIKEHWEFIRTNASEPWILEYVDGVARKEYRAQGYFTLEQVKTAFIAYLRSDGEWRQDYTWDELDTRNNPFPNPMPDEAFELVETIPNDALRLEQLPSADADGTEVWRFADTFNGSKYWGSLDRCAEVANVYFYDQQRDANLTELRTALFFECRRWHYFGELPDRHDSPYVRALVEKIRAMVAAGRVE
jgi:hypothetical protein